MEAKINILILRKGEDFYVCFMSSHDQKQSKLSGVLQDSAKAHGFCIV